MQSNEKLIKRADFALANLSGAGDGGLLTVEQVEKFMDIAVSQSTLLPQVSRIDMLNPTWEEPKMAFKGMAATVHAENTASTGRVAPDTELISLAAKNYKAVVHMSYESLEDSVERGKLEEHIVRLFAAQFSQDMEALGLNSDTGGAAPFDAQDGWLKLMTTNVVNNASAGPTDDMFTNGLQAIPHRYLSRGIQNFKHFVSPTHVFEHRRLRADRATMLGDDSATKAIQSRGIEGLVIEGTPMLAAADEASFGAQDGPSAQIGFLCDPKNLLLGIYRKISIERDKDIDAQFVKYVLSTRVAFGIREEDACVKYTNIA